VFDYDDLTEDVLLALCLRAKPDSDDEKDIVYIWRGEDFDQAADKAEIKEFIDNVCEQFWGKDFEFSKV